MSNLWSFDSGASAYDRFMGRWSGLYVPVLLAATEVRGGDRVLEVAAGTGAATLAAASIVGASGLVVATDISVPMLQAARRKVERQPVKIAAMSGQALACKTAAFDVVICQLGLMFLPDAAAGMEEFRRVLRPGGRAGACVWSTPDRVPLIGILADALCRQLPARREELLCGFSLGDPDRLQQLLTQAGFRNVRVRREHREVTFESFDDYWRPVESGGARLGQAYRQLSEAARRAVQEEVRRRIREFEANGRVAMDVEAFVATGTA